VLLTISLVPIIIFVWNSFQERRLMTDAAVQIAAQARASRGTKPKAKRRVGLHVFLICTWGCSGCRRSLWALFTSFRPYSDTAQYGYVSWPKR
jgi:hypothetical protein